MANVILETSSAWDVLEDTKLPAGYRVEITEGAEDVQFGDDLVVRISGDRKVVIKTDGFQ